MPGERMIGSTRFRVGWVLRRQRERGGDFDLACSVIFFFLVRCSVYEKRCTGGDQEWNVSID